MTMHSPRPVALRATATACAATFLAMALGLSAALNAQPPKPAAPANTVSKTADLLAQASELSKAGEHEKALAVLEKAKRASKDDPDVLTAYAQGLRALARIDEARETLHAVLKLRPGSPVARLALGETYLDLAAEQLSILRSAGPAAQPQATALLEACKALPARVQPPEKK